MSVELTARRRATQAGWLDRLDRMGPVRFVLTLYVARWLALAPLLLVPATTGAGSAKSVELVGNLLRMPTLQMLVVVVLVAPLVETLIECTLPFLAMRWLMPAEPSRPARSARPTRPARAWPFIAASAAVMVLVHPLEPLVVLATAVTGTFLAYTYAHFARAGHLAAITATAVFHAGINLVGGVLLALA